MSPNGEAEKLAANRLSVIQSEGETYKNSMLIKSEEKKRGDLKPITLRASATPRVPVTKIGQVRERSTQSKLDLAIKNRGKVGKTKAINSSAIKSTATQPKTIQQTIVFSEPTFPNN